MLKNPGVYPRGTMNLEDFLALDLNTKYSEEQRSQQSVQACYRVQDLLQKFGYDVPYKPKASQRLLDESCGNCQKPELYCGQVDIGFTDHYDNFWHLCLNCLDAKHQERYSGLGQESVGDSDCPFCGYTW